SDLTGYFVDNLDLHDGTTTYLENNAEGLAVPSELVAVSGMGSHGQLWHIEEVTFPPAPSDSLVMRLSNVAGEYDPNLQNALISPRISLEGYSPDSTEILCDFYIRGSLNVSDPEVWPNLDYWTVQVSPDLGTNWYSYGDPWGQGGVQHLWIDANNNYTQFSEMIGGSFDLTPYGGYAIQLRILFVSDGDQYLGTGLFVDNVWITTAQVGVNEPVSSVIPSQFSLGKNYPNPFNARTSFSYSLPMAALVKFSLYDAAGREVSSDLSSPLPQGWHEAGTYRANFDAEGLPSGLYLYRLQADDFSAAGKMILLK
ncbi:MAG TPA: T9SS type A sorting domain-containing protein, partial [bacterium]